ncbi:CRS2-like protein, chloroplastic isoform X2 [Triticum aestivum]|uniref:CRS2-like protein, chloroplastic isoform X2 n=1 Tax=Triticum aestivum TaxID=4565 RepID=UPI001D01735A|nr:CRS2-like protein, chloroplastic isoform X2 [Triticum aestivum]
MMRGKLWVRLAPFLSKRYVSSSSSPSCSATQPWLFIGLGNPGEKYQSTRHNVGFDMIDAFAESQNISLTKNHFKALFGEGMVDGIPVLLAKPQTYINLSGESAGALAAYYKLPLHRVVVAYDDTDLPCGVLRLQPKGGYGRHNGLKSVIYHFRKNREFGRLRGLDVRLVRWIPKLLCFRSSTRLVVNGKGLTEAARVANVDQKYKHLVSHDQQLL